MRLLVSASLAGLLLISCSGSDEMADCERFVVRELRVDTIRQSVGLSDGTLFVADWRDNELYKDAPSRPRIATSIDGGTVAALDYATGLVWVSHGRPANRVDAYDPQTLEALGTVTIDAGQPIAVFEASGDRVLVQVAEGGAVVVDDNLAVVGTITDNGPAVVVADSEYGMLDGRLVELGCG